MRREDSNSKAINALTRWITSHRTRLSLSLFLSHPNLAILFVEASLGRTPDSEPPQNRTEEHRRGKARREESANGSMDGGGNNAKSESDRSIDWSCSSATNPPLPHSSPVRNRPRPPSREPTATATIRVCTCGRGRFAR